MSTKDQDAQMKEAAEKYIRDNFNLDKYDYSQEIIFTNRAYLTAAREWYRKGQEEMRERAAKVAEDLYWYEDKGPVDGRWVYNEDVEHEIRALPIEEDEK